jgi:endonuclease/exonuclease/phosphatase family metal-dependent hydrolase
VSISIATWNTEWATPSSDRGRRVSSILQTVGADIAVVTEGVRELLPAAGSVVDAGDNWGYGPHPARRKVIVWSRYPMTLDFIGKEGATRGRLAVATVETPAGPVRILGVCIPWRDAHVNTGRGDASPWSEHLDYLDRFERLLAELEGDVPTVIAGDFNQRIPRVRQPIRVADRLGEVLADWRIHTAGALPNGPHIDHIATNRRFALESVSDWPASDHLGRLSDHAGVICRLGFADHSIEETSGGSASRRHGVEREHAVTPPAAEPPIRDRRVTSEGVPTGAGALTVELRAEIEDVLRRSGDGLSHGATFRLRERGLGEAQIAVERGVSINTTRGFLRSLDALLTGTLLTTKSLALTNSYVYRELLNHPRSDNLDSYVRAQLAKLRSINPDVRFDPLQTRTHQYRVGERKSQKANGDICQECAAIGIIHSGRCQAMVTNSGEVTLPAQWQAALNDAVSDAERDLIRALAEAGVAVPALGFETDDGEVIDLAWADARVGVSFDGEAVADGWILCPADIAQIVAALKTNGGS